MKAIERLSEQISEEINDATNYAKLALELKDECPWLADVYYKLSTEECRHKEILHESAVRMIKEYRATKGEPPANMLAVYDYLHRKQIEAAQETKTYQDMYKS